MPTSFDLAFAAFFAVGLVVLEYLVFRLRMRARLAANSPGARLSFYRSEVTSEWLLVLVVVARWIALRRPWSGLGLMAPTGWRLAVSLVVVLPLAWMIWKQH